MPTRMHDWFDVIGAGRELPAGALRELRDAGFVVVYNGSPGTATRRIRPASRGAQYKAPTYGATRIPE
jgi:hypothetical protein